MKKLFIYGGFFVLLLTGFYFLLFKNVDLSQSNLAVINDHVQPFSFIDQNGKKITQKEVAGKVYVIEYFFTTCRGICPRINANMRRVFDEYKGDSNFVIISHTCMPETDSVLQLKRYEYKMLTGKLIQNEDGEYEIQNPASDLVAHPTLPATFKSNWFFVTGDKAKLYDMAKHSYLVDNNQADTTKNIKDQFIHTQFFALMDKQGRVRGIYDGLKEDEVEKLLADIKDLLNEKVQASGMSNGWSNTPN